MKVYAMYLDFAYPEYIAGFPSEGADLSGLGNGFTVEEALLAALEIIYQGMDDPDHLDWDSIEKECREQLSDELQYPDAQTLANNLGFDLDEDNNDCPFHYVGVRIWF